MIRQNHNALPRRLTDFHDIHDGKTIIVCGCGSSLNEFQNPEQYITISVNDVGRLFTPSYLVVLNPRTQFKGDRFRYVENSRAGAVFTQLDLGIKHPNVVRFKLGKYGGTDFTDTHVLHFTRNSPYVALCLAVHMGAKRIGLIGIDFTDNHFFGNTGRHNLAGQLEQIDKEYKSLAESCKRMGIEIVNLSGRSRLSAFPRMNLNDFFSKQAADDSTDQSTRQLNIISYSTTPVAGVPAILSRCINSQTPHNSRCIWATNDYGNGVRFEGDVEWSRTPEKSSELLLKADVIIIHNGKVAAQHRKLIAGKPIITMAHNYMWNVDQTYVKKGFPGVVVGQYQAALPEFQQWNIVPNPVPLWEPGFQPAEKPEEITICYTPSGKHEKYPYGHRLYWHSKGYGTTMRVLDYLASRYPIRLEVIRDRQVSHERALIMKQRAHIVIDECATGSYHRNSLEGLAVGCAVVNGMGLLPEVVKTFQLCSEGASRLPFIYANLETVENELIKLIEGGEKSLTEEGIRNRHWMEQHWQFAKQWDCFWAPAVEHALIRAGRKRTVEYGSISAKRTQDTSIAAKKMQRTCRKKDIAVVIPHGGKERLNLLHTSLLNILKYKSQVQIIVVEMDDTPYAVDVSRSLADRYIFVESQGLFNKSRAMNTGIPFVDADLLLWLDNDVLFHNTFLDRAKNEIVERGLDCLVPATAVRYLSAQDSLDVMGGSPNPESCRPVSSHYARRGACGAAVMVRTEFVRKYGGMNEGFMGWGGEDNAWFYKAGLLGRAAITNLQDQYLYHLYHERSGGYASNDHIKKNPNYQNNVELLKTIRTIRRADEYLKRFPPPSTQPPPWKGEKGVLFVNDETASHTSQLVCRVIANLNAHYGIRVRQHAIRRGKVRGAEQCETEKEDAVVVFGIDLASQLLSNEAFKTVWHKCIVVHDHCEVRYTGDTINLLERAAYNVIPISAELNTNTLERLRPWTWEPSHKALNNANDVMRVILQCLSVVLGKKVDKTLSGIDFKEISYKMKGEGMKMTVAKAADMELAEFAAFNLGRTYPHMRCWELPFALFEARLGNTMAVLDCTINPVDFQQRLHSLYPTVFYNHWQVIKEGKFNVPMGLPDRAFDRVICVNTLEHLTRSQREILIRELSRKLKPGGLLVITCDYYFESLWDRPEILNMGVMRKDRQEIFNGWNKVTFKELTALCKTNDLYPGGEQVADPLESDQDLYRNVEPYPHACIGAVFQKGKHAVSFDSRKVALSVLTWNTKDVTFESIRAVIEEANMFKRLGHKPFVVICDNGSTDGTSQALRELERYIDVPHHLILNKTNRGSSIARNQIIDVILEAGSDYLMFMDGDIEVVPFSGFAMLRHMENCGYLLGCVGADSFDFSDQRARTTKYLYSIADCKLEQTNLVAWTQYGMFRREVFEEGVRFDDNEPFDREGWGFEDNDLAFQMHMKGFYNQRFYGITYLHRHHSSSVRIMRELGIDPNYNYRRRKEYVIKKWADIPPIKFDPLRYVRSINVTL